MNEHQTPAVVLNESGFLVGDMWNELCEIADGRRIMSSDVALRTTERGSYCLIYTTYKNTSDEHATAVAQHLLAIGCKVRQSNYALEKQRLEQRVAKMREQEKLDLFDDLRLPLLPSGKQTNGAGGKLTGNDDWYVQLRAYVTGGKPNAKGVLPCLVLWGKPGVGKTLALRKLEREFSDSQTMTFRLVSCGDFEMSEAGHWALQLDELRQLAAKHRNLVLCIDDFDVMHANNARKADLIAFLRQTECLRVLVTEDFFCRANQALRKNNINYMEEEEEGGAVKPKRAGGNVEFFTALQAKGVHHGALAERLAYFYPLLGLSRCKQLAEMSDGDARAALLSAQMEMVERNVGATEKTSEQLAKEARAADLVQQMRRSSSWQQKSAREALDDNATRGTLQSQAPNWRLLSLARQRDSVRPGVEAAYADLTFDEIENMADLLYTNAPRFVIDRYQTPTRVLKKELTVQREIDEAIDDIKRLSKASKAASFAAAYAAKCRLEAFSGGGDEEEIDKQLLLEFALLAPLTRLRPIVPAAAEGKWRSNGPKMVGEPVLEFPVSNLRTAVQRLQTDIELPLLHIEGVGKVGANKLVVLGGEEKRKKTANFGDAKALRFDTYCSVFFGDFYDEPHELVRYLKHTMAKRTAKPVMAVPPSAEVERWWCEQMQRMAECGVRADDFVTMCRFVAAKKNAQLYKELELPPTGDLVRFYARHKLVPTSDDPTVVREIKWQKVASDGTKKRGASEEKEAKKRRVGVKEAPKKLDSAALTRTLTGMNFVKVGGTKG